MEEDNYILEVEAYITENLSEKKEDRKYQVYFGRYEILKDDVRSISVAVTGEDTFYLQYWVTKYPDGTYECFPLGGSYMGEPTTGLNMEEHIQESCAEIMDEGFYLDDKETAGYYRLLMLEERFLEDLEFLYQKVYQEWVRVKNYELEKKRDKRQLLYTASVGTSVTVGTNPV